jgi:hypothetical protein
VTSPPILAQLRRVEDCQTTQEHLRRKVEEAVDRLLLLFDDLRNTHIDEQEAVLDLIGRQLGARFHASE